MRVPSFLPMALISRFLIGATCLLSHASLPTRFYINSFKALRHFTANMDVLIMIGTNAAYFYSVFSIIMHFADPGFEVQPS